MRSSAIVASLVALALADKPIDYWYRLCSKDTLKNGAVKHDCPGVKAKCLRNSELYQRSLFECYKQAESMSPRPKGDLAYERSIQYLGSNLKGEGSLTLSDLKALDISSPINQTYAKANSTGSGPFKPRPAWLTQSNVDGQSEWTFQHEWTITWGLITCYYVFGIVVVQTILNFLSWTLPSVSRALSNNVVSRYLRRYIALPALLNKHRSTPVRLFRYIQLCFPPRLHVLLIAGYVLLCIVGLAWHYPLIYSKAVESTKADVIGGYLGYRSGGLLVYKLPLIYLFAGRNNFMIWLTGWQMEVFNHWHRWIARLATIDVIIHGIAYTVTDVAGGTYHTKRTPFGWWRAGVAAAVVMGIMCIQATKTMRSAAYEVFLYVHIVAAVSIVVMAYYHVAPRNFGMYEVYAVIAVWGFDRVVRFVRILLSGINNKATIRCMPGGVIEITVNYSGLWAARAGSYCFVHFGHPLFWFQSHPLSVVPVEGNKKQVKFFSKAQKGITRIMHDRAAAAGGVIETRMWLDGEYGVQWPTKQFNDVVLFAGGIGFTSVYSHAISLLKSGTNQTVHLNWAISDSNPLTTFATELANLNQYPNLRLTVFLNTGSPVAESGSETQGSNNEKKKGEVATSIGLVIVEVNLAPDFNSLVQRHVEQSTGPLVFFSCGPPRMADVVRDAVATHVLSSKNYVQFYEESFTM